MLGLAVVGAVLYTLFQKSAPAFGLFVSMGAAVLVLWKISTAAEIVLAGLERLEQRAGGDAFPACCGVQALSCWPTTPAHSARKPGPNRWRGARHWQAGCWCWRRRGPCWKRSARRSGALRDEMGQVFSLRAGHTVFVDEPCARGPGGAGRFGHNAARERPLGAVFTAEPH